MLLKSQVQTVLGFDEEIPSLDDEIPIMWMFLNLQKSPLLLHSKKPSLEEFECVKFY